MNQVIKRILEISYNKQLSHLSSNLTTAPIIESIYFLKNEHEPFVLSCGHAGLALYCVLESKYGFNAEKLYEKHGTHPNYSKEDKIYFSTGSLGMGICASVGYALSDRNRKVHCLISDGEYFDGKVKEALTAKKMFKLDNLGIYINLNGHSALQDLNVEVIEEEIKVLCPDVLICKNSTAIPLNINTVDGHYKKINKEEYEELLDFYA